MADHGGVASLTGAPAARRLYREVAADPHAPLRVDVVGPGGSGKTVLLDALAEVYRRAGLTVARTPEDFKADGTVLLLDDAQRLPLDTLDAAREFAAAPDARLLVAHRPWPRTPELAALGSALARVRGPLVLGPLDRAGVAARATMLLGARPDAPQLDLACELTGGLPLLVDRLLSAWRDNGLPEASGDGSGTLARQVPGSVSEQLRYDLDRLPRGLRALLVAVAAGAPADLDVLSGLLEVPTAAVVELMDEGDAVGLLAGDGTLQPLVEQALLRVSPAARLLGLRRRLAELQLARGGSMLATGQRLLGAGATGAPVAAVLRAAGEEALRDGRPAAHELLAAAEEAGAPAEGLAAQRVEAAALSGDLDGALELADRMLSDQGLRPGERARAVRVAAAVLARRGLLGRSAELYRWLAAHGEPDPLAVPVLVGTGALEEARELLAALGGRGSAGRASAPDAQSARPSTTSGQSSTTGGTSGTEGGGSAEGGQSDALRGAPGLGTGAPAAASPGIGEDPRGIRASGPRVGAGPSAVGASAPALAGLVRAAALLERASTAVGLPESPAALAALVALQVGAADVTRSVLERAVAAGLGGPAMAARHRLLQGWVALQTGQAGRARALLAEADATPGGLPAAEELLAAALGVALERRSGELPALRAAWPRAREALVQHPVDLFMLPPLAELAVAAARLGERHWVAGHLEDAWALLGRLGEPVLWTVPLHWAELQAALAAGDPAEAQAHAAALRAAAPAGRVAAALAEAAGHWLRLGSGEVDAEGVADAAHGLRAVGWGWEGARLAGQAALRTRDRRAMTMLLECARSLHQPQADPGATSGPPTAMPPGRAPGIRAAPVAPAPAEPGAPANPATPASPVAPAPPAPAAAGAQPGGARSGPDAPGDFPEGFREAGSGGGPPDRSERGPAGLLSPREGEIARRMLAGQTYKQIGEQLFLSPKTVGYHVAHMRRRFGAASRSELFAHLRAELDGEVPG